jgi:predicted amidophosphoribosyltransferase
VPLTALARALVPRLCACCGSAISAGGLCAPCGRALGAQVRAAPALRAPVPAGLDAVRSAAPHEGVARQLLAALKFRRLTAVAPEIAAWLAPLLPDGRGRLIVPVPPASRRLLPRGFDPAGEIAHALHLETGAAYLHGGLRRLDRGRQARRSRSERLAHPPRVECGGGMAERVLLVDDVLTTGATLSACARALRGAGAVEVVGVTFTREL